MSESVRGRLTRHLAQRLRDDGNTITDIARLCGVSRPTVYGWLRGTPAKRQHLRRLGATLNTDAQVLIDALTGKRMADDE